MTAAPQKGPWFDVPAGTEAAECRSCHATVYWITTARGKRMPVAVDVDGGYAPSDRQTTTQHDGHGVSHFSRCPEADAWRRS